MDYIKVGQIIGTFGIRGEIKLFPITSDINRFDRPVEYYIGIDGPTVTVGKYRQDKNILIIKFNEFDNINLVEQYKGEYLYISSDDLMELEEDQYYHHDILGLKVYENTEHIGEIIDIIENPSNDIYVVKTTEGREFYLPAVKQFIKKVDLTNRCMEVKLIQGMKDEI
ncbi:ribosome maturation factor RimM [Microaceticoccus formicicus]|uniref:ribosome maturation factor RimM n=1 Tax=Microaceticoccus formicicus TaxID=3118105 RepID=UPI003CCFF61A|nr:ribosome maturation factor RimM [Peptoniphilaceae bacterium AMB_02]